MGVVGRTLPEDAEEVAPQESVLYERYGRVREVT